MKFNGKTTLRLFVAAVICSASASAFAFGDVFDSGLFKNISSNDAYVEDSFFGGQELTMGDMNFNAYAASSVDSAYGECSDCQGGDVVYDAPVYGYNSVATYGYGYSDCDCVVDGGWYAAPATPIRTTVRAALRAPGAVLRGVRNFLFGNGYNYCKPAYVCDPCWSVCDPCADWAPCAAPCDACAPVCAPACEPCAPACAPCDGAVFAPRSCCGDGYYPGKLNELNPATGKPVTGNDVDKVLNVPKTDKKASEPANSDVAPAVDPSAASAAPVAPAVPAVDSAMPQRLDGEADGFEDAEEIDTPLPTTGAGVIRMLVPEDAVVYVNGYRTKQKGAVRTFAAKKLQVGETYAFEIRVVAVRGGQTYEDVQTTTLTAGDSTALAFNLTLRDNEAYAFNK